MWIGSGVFWGWFLLERAVCGSVFLPPPLPVLIDRFLGLRFIVLDVKITQEFDLMRILAEMDVNLAEVVKRRADGYRVIDLDVSANWVTPIHLIALAASSNHMGIDIMCNVSKSKTRAYINRIRFPTGTRDVFSSGTAIPLTMLDSRRDDDVLGEYEERILRDVDRRYRSNFENTLKYMTSELTTNIREHSHSESYWILAQHWPSTDTCEIAIADTGIGYLESYRGTDYEVENHHDAITNALEGRSSKNNVERGAGVPSTVRIFTEGYGGEVVVMTGDAIRVVRGSVSTPYRLGSYWQGTLIGLHFDMKNVNIHPFLGGY